MHDGADGALLLIVWVFVFTWFIHRRKPLESFREACVVGLVWASTTALFKALMVVLLLGKPIAEAAAQYDLTAGN